MKSRLSNTGVRFRSTFKRTDGHQFFGQLLDIPDTARVSNFLSARRYLRTNIGTQIKPADVITAHNKDYIVAQHGDGFFNSPIYTHFKLFQVDKTYTWSKHTLLEDDVTGIKEITLTAQATKIPLSIQPKSLIEDTINIQQQSFVAVASEPVKVNDTLDNMVVTRVDNVLGVYLLELKEI